MKVSLVYENNSTVTIQPDAVGFTDNPLTEWQLGGQALKANMITVVNVEDQEAVKPPNPIEWLLMETPNKAVIIEENSIS